jgi:hypothetical protein
MPVPLYSSPERSRVVAELQLPLSGAARSTAGGGGSEQQQWVLAGVALVLAG